jgi:hypothetical protein
LGPLIEGMESLFFLSLIKKLHKMGFVGATIPTTKKLVSMFGVEFDLHNMDCKAMER